MKEKFSDFFQSCGSMWQNASKKARTGFLAATAAILLFCLVVVLALNHTEYVLLYNYNYLSAQESAAVLAALGEAGIEPKVEHSGAIYVAQKDIDKARMQLATQGFVPSGLTYDAYNTAAGSLTATQSDKEVAKLHQLQDRLQATIETFDEVSQAIVTISLPQNSVYALEANTLPPSAAIKIRKMPGRELSREQVQGIINIVKNSVAGLEEENISISDESGDLRLLMESGLAGGTSKLDLTSQVNGSIRDRVLTILQPLYGSDHVRVAVNTVLDNDQKVTEETIYQPFDEENPQNNPIRQAEVYREKVGGDGIAQGVPGAEDNVNVPRYGAQDIDVTDGDSFVANDVYEYLVGSVRNQIVKEGYVITDVSVAVVIDKPGIPNMDEVIELVARASGVDPNYISVKAIAFNKEEQEEPVLAEDDFVRVLILAGAAAAALLILIILIAVLVSRRRRRRRLEDQDLETEGGNPLLVDLMGANEDFEPISFSETTEQKLKAQIKDLAESDPEIVAQLIKTWLLQA